MLRTRIHAIHVGRLAAQALSGPGPRDIGEIVAAFPNSFYLKTRDHELIFVTNRELKSPITINLNSKADLVQIAKPSEVVSLLENEIRIGELGSIDLNGASSYERYLVPQVNQFAVARESLQLGSLILMIVDTHLSVLDPAGFAYSGALEFVSKGVVPFRRSGDAEHFCDAARKIVGLGGGFTPSGDDLLGGFLATYNSFAQQKGGQIVLLNFDLIESKTSWISAKLLDYMQRRVLDDQISELIRSAASSDTDSFIVALETLLPRGHTSGIDILVGVILALSLTYDIQSKTNETRAVADRLGLLS